jgi:hypothetical protein
MSAAVRFMGSILTATTSRQERSGTRDRAVARTRSDRTADAARGAATKSGGCRSNRSARTEEAFGRGEGATASPGTQVTERLRVTDVCRRRSARRSVPRACRRRSPSTVDPGREQPRCFARAPVPDPVRGLLTPRLSVLLSAPRSRARSRSPDTLNRRSERRSDRSLVARLIRSPDELAADV